MKLDIHSRNGKIDGHVGIDSIKTDQVDIVHPLESYPWPIEDNEVEEAVCSHYITLVPDIIPFMNELYRICKPGATVKFVCYYFTSGLAHLNPRTVRSVNEGTFSYFDKNIREANNFNKYDFNFKAINIAYHWQEPWNKKSDEARDYAKNHYWNVVDEILFEMECVK